MYFIAVILHVDLKAVSGYAVGKLWLYLFDHVLYVNEYLFTVLQSVTEPYKPHGVFNLI
jgi:hypothetical protein